MCSVDVEQLCLVRKCIVEHKAGDPNSKTAIDIRLMSRCLKPAAAGTQSEFDRLFEKRGLQGYKLPADTDAPGFPGNCIVGGYDVVVDPRDICGTDGHPEVELTLPRTVVRDRGPGNVAKVNAQLDVVVGNNIAYSGLGSHIEGERRLRKTVLWHRQEACRGRCRPIQELGAAADGKEIKELLAQIFVLLPGFLITRPDADAKIPGEAKICHRSAADVR
jgi:hypothetical protein